ncbi:hypothetical protein D3C77_395820 [compost metagenome]
MQHQAAHLDFVFGAAGDAHLETLLGFIGRQHLLMVQALGNVAQQDVGTEHHTAADCRLQQQAHAAQHPDRSGAPQRCGGVQTAHIQAIAHDHATAEKTDARHHIGGNTRSIGGGHARHGLGHQHEQAGAGADQGIGAQAGQALAQLTFSADQGTQYERDGDAQEKYFPIHDKPRIHGARPQRIERRRCRYE